MTSTLYKQAAYRAVFLCLLFMLLPSCAAFHEPVIPAFSAKKGAYKVNIVVVDDAKVRQKGRVAYYYNYPATIVLSDRNTLECAAHEVGHALGWKHKESSYAYCKNWGVE
jgi:hypothetical protein